MKEFLQPIEIPKASAPSDIAHLLRSLPASMLGTKNEDVYWLCQDAAGWIDALLRAEDRGRESLSDLLRAANDGCYRYGWYEGILLMIASGNCDDPSATANLALDRFDGSRGSTATTTAVPRKTSKKKR